MLSEFITDSETLYKAIKITVPNQWDIIKNQPTSAAFKDSKGLSVDRDGGRKVEVIISIFRKRFELKAVISLTAKDCRDSNTIPIAKPIQDNPFHAEIHSSSEKRTLTSGQARALKKKATVVLS